MSGLFDRIARRRSDEPAETTSPAPAAPQPHADVPDDQPTRFIGLPADAVTPAAPGQQPADAHAEPAADDEPLTTAAEPATPAEEPLAADTESATPEEPQPPAPAEEPQPTALFPLVPDQPTEAHDALAFPDAPEPAPPAFSAAETGTEIVRASTPAPPAVQAAADQPQPGAAAGDQPQPAAEPLAERRPGFRERGRMRRRLRYLRRLRELQVRDLGGLAFDLRRFERKRDDLVAQKVDQIRACDDELHALEVVLDERRDIRDVRMPGIGGACPRCFSIYGSSDRFCSHCGAALGGLAQGPAQVAVPAPPPPAPALPPAAPSAPTSPQPPR